MSLLKTIFASITLIVLLCAGSGCVGVQKSAAPQPTVGKELIDLKEARERGVITEQEYQTLKGSLVSGKKRSCGKGSCPCPHCPHASKGRKGEGASCPMKDCPKKDCACPKGCPMKDCPKKRGAGDQSDAGK